MMRFIPLVAPLLLLPIAAWPQQRGLNLQATPQGSPLLPVPHGRPRDAPAASGPDYALAPTPNRDLDAPSGPRATNAPALAPSLFTRGQQYRGDGYSTGSSAQAEQERRARPGAGFKLRLPLQPE